MKNTLSGIFNFNIEKNLGKAVETVEVVFLEIEEAARQRSRDFLKMTRQFFKLQASGGVLLVLAALIALIVANTPLYDLYNYVLNKIEFRIGFAGVELDTEIRKSLLLWVNDGLMVLFFFLVGLEIKREMVEGELSRLGSASLPFLAALGGMVVPAAIYWLINRENGEGLYGWAIPAATDIAFALGVLSLLGPRAPIRLKILLAAIAIIDDIGAILVIAIFYSHHLSLFPLWFAGVALAGLFLLNRTNVLKIAPYVMFGVILWVSLLESGIHATLAGVITALFIPLGARARKKKKKKNESPLKSIEHMLHPWVAFGVLPLFAFANAGVPLRGFGLSDFGEPVTLGIICGLFFGKQIGVFSMMVFAVKSGVSEMPHKTTWKQLYALSTLCGIGFTMSLFIGSLAFSAVEMQAAVRVGVLTGSVASALLAFFLLRYTSTDHHHEIKGLKQP